MVHGTSKYMKAPADFVAAAEFEDFAPAPCVCCTCFVGDSQKKRTYAHVYENKIESNTPLAPCLCCTTQLCMKDMIYVSYFDKPPARSGLCCFIPCTCCGPPVLFVKQPKFLCMDTTSCFGETVSASPCDCFGLKTYICCGNPCYVCCSSSVVLGVKKGKGEEFLSAMKAAVDKYAQEKGIPDSEKAIFARVSDNILDFGGAKTVQSGETMTEYDEGLVVNQKMQR